MQQPSNVVQMPYQRAGVPTETPQARADITAAIDELIEHRRTVQAALEYRDHALRKHYAAGVDVRDLVRIAKDAGWAKAHEVAIHRIVKGARPAESA